METVPIPGRTEEGLNDPPNDPTTIRVHVGKRSPQLVQSVEELNQVFDYIDGEGKVCTCQARLVATPC